MAVSIAVAFGAALRSKRLLRGLAGEENIGRCLGPALATFTTRMQRLMISILVVFVVVFVTTVVDAFSMADPSTARSFAPQTDFKGGAGVGRLVLDCDGTPSLEQWSCKYDMVLVERIQGRPPADSGLFVPRENLPKLHLCRGEFGSRYL